jgi:hypothetical protein
VGKAQNFTFGQEVAAYISMNLDGSSLSGQAFDVYTGNSFQLTGTLTGDAVSLTVVGGGQTFTGSGTLTRHPDGSPDEAQGTLSDGSSFSVAACRLN